MPWPYLLITISRASIITVNHSSSFHASIASMCIIITKGYVLIRLSLFYFFFLTYILLTNPHTHSNQSNQCIINAKCPTHPARMHEYWHQHIVPLYFMRLIIVHFHHAYMRAMPCHYSKQQVWSGWHAMQCNAICIILVSNHSLHVSYYHHHVMV